jgi:hypothetical protein
MINDYIKLGYVKIYLTVRGLELAVSSVCARWGAVACLSVGFYSEFLDGRAVKEAYSSWVDRLEQRYGLFFHISPTLKNPTLSKDIILLLAGKCRVSEQGFLPCFNIVCWLLSLLVFFRLQLIPKIFSRLWLTVDEVCMDNWIYWTIQQLVTTLHESLSSLN